jgi:GTPase SAR1 family protein
MRNGLFSGLFVVVRLSLLAVLCTAAVPCWGWPAADDAEGEAIRIQAEWSTLLLNIESKFTSLKKRLTSAGIQFDASEIDRLWNKIGPQATITNRPLLIMLMGQHNSGKSTFVNMMIGARGNDRVTKVSDVGGSTKVPVALLPQGFPEKDLVKLFGGFDLQKLRSAEDATRSVPEGVDRMLWLKHKLVPPSVAIIDTPDLDSCHRENSLQTYATINVADVVAVMITDQYKNDRVVDALRVVAAAKKPVILIFNKVNLVRHTRLWPKRLEELQKLTGIEVLDSFVIEDNPELAEAGEILDLYRIGQRGQDAPAPRKPLDSVLDLQVTQIRIQSEWGALSQALHSENGLSRFVETIEETNSALDTLIKLFSGSPIQEKEWPSMPVQAVGQAILETWGKHHRTMTTTIVRSIPNYLKKGIGSLMKWRYQAAMDKAEKEYRQAEFNFLRDHVISFVLNELNKLKESGKIRGKLAEVIAAKLHPVSVSQMQAALQTTHENMRLLDSELNQAIVDELNRLKTENSTFYNTLQNFDVVIAGLEAVGPMAVGLGAGQLLSGPLLSNFATSLIAPYAQVAAGASVWSSVTPATAVGGDKVRNFALRQSFRNILGQYQEHRISWVMEWLKDNYLKEFYDELGRTSSATGAGEVGELKVAISCAERLGEQVLKMARRSK